MNSDISYNWSVYLLLASDNKRTYIGASNNPERRLRCHNGEISGGAKATRTSRPWKHIAIISGLDKISALQLEWRLKKWHCPKNGKLTSCPGIKNRISNIFNVLHLDKWTSKSKLSRDQNLSIKWFIESDIINDGNQLLPINVKLI